MKPQFVLALPALTNNEDTVFGFITCRIPGDIKNSLTTPFELQSRRLIALVLFKTNISKMVLSLKLRFPRMWLEYAHFTLFDFLSFVWGAATDDDRAAYHQTSLILSWKFERLPVNEALFQTYQIRFNQSILQMWKLIQCYPWHSHWEEIGYELHMKLSIQEMNSHWSTNSPKLKSNQSSPKLIPYQLFWCTWE